MQKFRLLQVRRAAVLCALTLIYYFAGRYGLSLASLNSNASPVWPPTGLAIGSMVLLGRWTWPSVLVGAFLVNFSNSGDGIASGMIACGNTFEALAGAWLADRFCGGRNAFENVANICKFALGPGMLAPAISAAIGLAALFARNLVPIAEAPRVWFTWWMGDAISALVLAPCVILLGREHVFRLERLRIVEGLALAAGLFLTGQLTFGGWLPPGQRNLPLEYLAVPFIVWGCYRFGRMGASAAVMMLASISVTGTLRGYGPFALREQNTSLLLLQAFLGTLSLTALILATALTLKRAAMSHMSALVEETRAANEKLRHAEEHIRQAQKMEAVGRLAGGVAHDFNNLLTAINGYSEVVLGRLSASDANRPFVEEIRKAGDRAALVTQQLLAFSRKQMVVPTVLGINQVISDLENMLAHLIGENIGLHVLPGDAGKIKADAGQVAQVVMNLVLNGRDAMPDGGDIIIATCEETLAGNETGFHLKPAPGRYVRVEVRDSGSGMETAVKDRLFEPFFSTKHVGSANGGSGTGLGLSTVYGIMEQNRGGLKVASEPGHGSILYAYFPCCDEDWTAGAPAEAESRTEARGRETILVVEDEENVRSLVRHVLEGQGYAVLEASGAREAMYVHENQAGRIDCLLTDVMLPGKSGRELARELIEVRPATKIIFMSGYTEDSVLRTEIERSKALFLGKPFSPTLLARTVRAALEGKPAPIETPA
jgi:two-component system cell cycle sensor histidine kinase/response regulator CckA